MIEDDEFIRFGNYVTVEKSNNDLWIGGNRQTFNEFVIIPGVDLGMLIDELKQACEYIRGTL